MPLDIRDDQPLNLDLDLPGGIEVVAEGQLSNKDRRTFFHYAFFPRWGRFKQASIFPFLFSLSLATAAGFVVYFHDSTWSGVIVTLFGYAAIFQIMHVWNYFASYFSQSLDPPLRILAGSEYLAVVLTNGLLVVPWERVADFQLARQQIILTIGENHYLIPRHYFPDEESWEHFQRLLIYGIGYCGKCDYQLRGSAGDTCPECGADIRLAVPPARRKKKARSFTLSRG